MAEWICYQLEKAIEAGKIFPGNIRKKKVYFELSGEPVTEEQVCNIVKRLEKIFQTEVEYSITYGSTEIGLIGTYIPTIHGSKIKYEVIPSLFVEIVDGEIIITPYRKQGTILFRYKTGDKGKLFFENGKPFLNVIGKSESEGIMYVAGVQVCIPELVAEIEKIANFPIGIKVIKKKDRPKGVCELDIKIHIPRRDALSNSLKNAITEKTKQFITDSAVLSVENHLGIVKINIHYSSEPIKKRFIIENLKA